MFTAEQESRFVAAIRKAADDVGLDKEDRAALVLGVAVADMEIAFGVSMAARQIYLIALSLAKKAGMDQSEMPSPTRH